MEIKIVFSTISVIGISFGSVPYLRDIWRRKTEPHLYTWFIWVITQGTVAAAAWYGGAGFGAVSLTIGVFINFVFFILSLKYGTKNITKIDTVMFVATLLAILVWWGLDNPILSVFMVTVIDLIGGYFPSFRKSYAEPWSETVFSWLIWAVANMFAILAVEQYNFLTMPYLVMIASANLILALICIWRRRTILKPSSWPV